ncbi:MAG TPA: acetate--CoA ligase family protein, partial [Gemmatimonadaceae bacterium]|nr:acetate--CoA ligase family protein [Gemmatimonadaceae bacterium]
LLTNAGGAGILAADATERYGLQLADIGPAAVDALRPLLPAEASVRNPVDMLASATPATYHAALATLLADPAVDAVVPIFAPPFGINQQEVAEAIAGAAVQSDKPVVAALLGVDGLDDARVRLQTADVPAYVFPESAMRALGALNRYAERRSRPAGDEPLDARPDIAAAVLAAARSEGRSPLSTMEVFTLLSAYGIATVDARRAHGPDSAARAAAELGYPVAMKIISPDITHKSDVGGVRLGVASEAEARATYGQLTQRVRERLPAARIHGVLVQKMRTDGREMIVGATRDPAYGPLVMFGLGGIYVEALADVVFGIAPIDQADALDLVRGIRAAKMLSALRGQPAVDIDALASVVRRVGQLASDFPEIRELDLNPVLALEQGAVVVDARARIAL